MIQFSRGAAASVFFRLNLVGTMSQSIYLTGIMPRSFRESSLVFLASGM